MKPTDSSFSMVSELEMTENGSIRSSEGACSSLGDEMEKARVLQKLVEVKDKLRQANEKREAEVEKFLAATRQAEIQKGIGTDNPQLVRIRHNFERHNKKYVQETEYLQRKLAEYSERIRLIDSGEYEPNQSRTTTISQGIRRAGQNMMSGPMELAQKLKNVFGSTDDVNGSVATVTSPLQNTNVTSTPYIEHNGTPGRIGQSTFYAKRRSNETEEESNTSLQRILSLPPAKVTTQPSTVPVLAPVKIAEDDLKIEVKKEEVDEEANSRPGSGAGNLSQMFTTANNSLYFPTAPLPLTTPIGQGELIPQLNEQLKNLSMHINTLEEKYERLAKDVEHELEINRQSITYYANALEDMRFKMTNLEGILNDTIELHQAEFASLKEQNIIATRIDYQHNDRFKLVDERIESIQNHFIRLENTIKDTLDVKLTTPVWGNAALSGANILVEMLKIFLFIVATVLDLVRPLTGSRNRAGFVVFILILLFLFGNHISLLNPFRLFSSSRVAINVSNTPVPVSTQSPEL